MLAKAVKDMSRDERIDAIRSGELSKDERREIIEANRGDSAWPDELDAHCMLRSPEERFRLAVLRELRNISKLK
jgi:hypothetical protein